MATTSTTSSKWANVVHRLGLIERRQEELVQTIRASCKEIEQLRTRSRLARSSREPNTLGAREVTIATTEAMDEAVRAAWATQKEATLDTLDVALVSARLRQLQRVDEDSAEVTVTVTVTAPVDLRVVERAMEACNLVEECRAFARGHSVFCVVVPKRSSRVSEAMLMSYAEDTVGGLHVPHRFFLVDALPTDVSRTALADTCGLPSAEEARRNHRLQHGDFAEKAAERVCSCHDRDGSLRGVTE
jgi:hypothetical protein